MNIFTSPVVLIVPARTKNNLDQSLKYALGIDVLGSEDEVNQPK